MSPVPRGTARQVRRRRAAASPASTRGRFGRGSLQWQDLDFKRGTALVRRTWSRQRLGPTKTGHARTVSLLHPVADDAADWRPGATDAARSVLAALQSSATRSRDPEAFVFAQAGGPG